MGANYHKYPQLSNLLVPLSKGIRHLRKKKPLRQLIQNVFEFLLTLLSPNLGYGDRDMQLLLTQWDPRYSN